MRMLAVAAVAVLGALSIGTLGVAAAQDAPATQPAEQDGPEGAEAQADAADAPPDVGDLLSLSALRRRLEEIRGRTQQTRARVTLLKDAVLRGGPSGTAEVVHRSKMGDQFRLTTLTYTIDGTRVFSQHDESGVLSDRREIDILTGPVAPGSHTVGVEMVYRGHGYGPFKYLNKQTFTVDGSETFNAKKGETVRVEVLGYEREDVPLEQRPAITIKVSRRQASK